MKSLYNIKLKNIKIFLELIEIDFQLFAASINLLGFIVGSRYLGSFNLINSCIYSLATISIFSCCNLINDLVDYKNAKDSFYKNNINFIGKYKISVDYITKVIFFFLLVSILLGIWLVYLTNIVLLFIGIICYSVAIFYTFGPYSISRSPFGEVTVFIIYLISYFIAVYIQKSSILSIYFLNNHIHFYINLTIILKTLFIFLSIAFLSTNFMLINNICDYDEDIKNDRKTLVHYLGENLSIKLYDLLMILSFISFLLQIIFGIIPIYSIVFLFILYLIALNTKRNFRRYHTKDFKKSSSFKLARVVFIYMITYYIILLIK
ncbi:MAG: UbiA family prenyltransferase [Streptococcus sp.]|nr:UbiA family prenyltransferase [Streptococcus sp.]